MKLEIDQEVEAVALCRHGILGRGSAMGNALYAMSYDTLPIEARQTIELIVRKGPFKYRQDGKKIR